MNKTGPVSGPRIVDVPGAARKASDARVGDRGRGLARGLCPLGLALALLGCSSSGDPLPGDAAADRALGDLRSRDGAAADRGRGDGAARDGALRDGAAADGAVQGLPFSYTRSSVGTPVSATELTAITDKYIELLKKTSYFEFVDERVHGWPQSDPQKRYWYGTWWSGVGLSKSGGKVTYKHVNVGGDNNGLRTGPVLEGICFAHKQWATTKLENLTRKLIRGFSSWIMAMERQVNDPAGTLLTRAAYPESVTSTDGGKTYTIDYSADRPGVDDVCEYVRIQANPYWGDIWIKNKRSKDDIGHMLRAIATLKDCASGFSSATQADNQAMQAYYVKWAKKVEADNWAIATYDKSAKPYIPPVTLTMSHFYTTGNVECDAVLALRLFGQGSPGTFNCSNGIHLLEWIALTNDHNGEIIRSFHEAAVKHALLTKQNTIAQTMLPGLTTRIEEGMTAAEANKFPVHLSTESLVDLIVHSANTGVPLTWREVRWVHQQIDQAYTQYVTNTSAQLYKVFDSSTPDGSYAYAPTSKGIHFKSLALLIGTCVATFRNPTSKPLLDCARLKTYAP